MPTELKKALQNRNRIIGIDIARALAVIGMIIVNFKIVFGEQGNDWLKAMARLFDGKAAATFVVLAGVGLALMTNSAITNQNVEKLKIAKRRIVKRSVFLFVIGLSYIWIWPADILHFYGIYMLVTLFFINKKTSHTLIAATGLIILYPMLLVFFDYEAGWNFTLLEYKDFWTTRGFLRNLLFNGFHPVLPWTSFMLFGLWYGRQDLNNDKFVKKSLWISSTTFILIQLVSKGLILFLSEGNPNTIEELGPVLGVDPMPPLPIYMLNGISISIVVISSCILVGKRYRDNKIIDALNKTGQLALTFYVAHVIIGMGIIEEFGAKPLGAYSINFSLIYATIFSLLCIVFAVIWLNYRKTGPLEWIIRKLTS